MVDISKEILKGALETLVMSVIQDSPSHGYLISKTLHQMTAGKLDLQDGTIYPLLHRLEKKGLIEGNWITDGTARRKKGYSITDSGRLALGEQKNQWDAVLEIMKQVLEVPHGKN